MAAETERQVVEHGAWALRVEMLQDLVRAAVNEAGRKVDEAIQEKMGGLAGGMKLPGL